MDESQVRRVRQFNRSLTQRIGALADDYLGRGRPLAESRLLFEIGVQGASVRDLRKRLGLDSGYVSRLLRSLESQGLVSSRRAGSDGRVRHVTLTRKGGKEYEALDYRSQAGVTELLKPLNAIQRERLVDAMAVVERLMRLAAVTIEPADACGDDARRLMAAYVNELDHRFEAGFDPTRGPPAGPGDFTPPAGLFLIAHLDDTPVACGGLAIRSKRIGEIKHMWVAPAARGLGIAQRLLEALESRADALGLDALRLDTNRSLKEAQGLYARNGYRAIPAYNDNPYAHHWYEKRWLRRRRRARSQSVPDD